MTDEAKTQLILDRVLAASKADETEALLIAHEVQLTRFANNAIHQNVAETNVTLTVRQAVGRRVGSASTNDLSDAGIEKVVETAHALVLASPEDPDFPGLPQGGTFSSALGFDEPTASCDPATRAEAVSAACRRAAEAGLNASGAFQTGTREMAVANSHGLRAYHTGTQADFLTTVMSEDSAGRAQCSGWRLADLDTTGAASSAIDKAARGRGPRELAPGEYSVVFEAQTTYDVIEMLAMHGMSAQAVQEGQSWMSGRQGERLMSESVHIWDDGHDPAGVPLPFDSEGVQRQRLEIVQAGVVGEPAHDSRTAAKAGRASTGHAVPPELHRWRTGPVPLNLFMAGGEATVDEMIAATDRGLYVTRFWYTRLVHPRECVVMGMTRDGLFWIEGGEIAYPVKNLRFTQAYVGALAGVQAISRETRLLANDVGIGVRVPAVKLASWRFTGSTR